MAGDDSNKKWKLLGDFLKILPGMMWLKMTGKLKKEKKDDENENPRK